MPTASDGSSSSSSHEMEQLQGSYEKGAMGPQAGQQDEYQNDTYKRRVAVSDFNMLGQKGFKKINVDFVDFSDEGVKDEFYRVVD